MSDAASHKKMIQAAKAGDIATVRALLEADPSLAETRDTDASTPLHCAAWKGHAEIAALLLDVGADIHARNRNEHWGDTPLHAAAHGNQRAVAALLIERGADIGARNAAGRTPLRETEFHNASSVARLLRERGAVS